MSTEQDLMAIKLRLDEGEIRMAAIERAVEHNTRITAESGEVIKDVRDALIFARIGTKVIKWLGAVGALVVTAFTIYTQWRKP
jgi:hypothetical protein